MRKLGFTLSPPASAQIALTQENRFLGSLDFSILFILEMSVNKVILLGYVGNDPEMRYPDKDRTIAYLSLATTEVRGTAQVETTEWHSLVFGNRNAQIVERYVRKGTQLYVEGYLHTREYEDRLKIVRRKTEIIVEKFEILGRKSM